MSEIVLGILASLIVLWFSRWREFRADRGGAKLAGRANMIAALEALKSSHEPLPQQFAAFGIADGTVARGFAKLRMSHPPLDERRIAAPPRRCPPTFDKQPRGQRALPRLGRNP